MCADYPTAVCKIQFEDDTPSQWDPVKPKVRTAPKVESTLARGLVRDRSADGDLLSFFDIDWSTDVDPTKQGELSADDSEKLLRKLKSRESLFEVQLAMLPRQEADGFRRRYQLLREFLKSAIERNEPIYLLE